MSMVYPCLVTVPAIIWVVSVFLLTQYWPGNCWTTGPIGLAIAGLLDLLARQLLDYWTYWPSNCWTTGPIGPAITGLMDLVLCMRLLISNLMFPGTVPAQATGWCGAAFPADSPRFPEVLQAGQVLCHLPRKRHGWRPPFEGWWLCAKGAWCKFCCRSQKDQDQVQDIHWVVS